jgi:hypothetical protein
MENRVRVDTSKDAEIAELKSLLEWIQAALDGEELSDFAMSFPIVSQAYETTWKANHG